jgi:carbon-monoxide dehydrogenase large subunit
MSLLGTRVKRSEDPRLLQGLGRYVGDLAPADALHAVFVRSVEAHGTITGIDLDDARAVEGVVAVLTAADLGLSAEPPSMAFLNQDMLRARLATDRVRYVGEPVAVVLAESFAAAVDAAELVLVEIDRLPPMVDPEQALAGEVLLFPEAGTNVCFAIPPSPDAEFFADCEVTVDLTFRNQRVSGAPIEPRTALARWDDGQLTQWSSTQFPHMTRDALAEACGIEHDHIRVITPEVGGGFGAKNGSYPEDVVVALAARHLGRPVHWAETRTESMLNLVHGRGQIFTATLGGDRSGNLTAYRLHILQDGGAYPNTGSILPMVGQWMATQVYDIPGVEFSCASVVTTTTPVGAYRGAGRPEATHALERMIDRFAGAIGMDPAEVRRRNFIAEDAFPFTTPSGQSYDSGRYEAALDAVLAELDLDGLRAEQARRRDDPGAALLGVGWAAYVEIANPTQAGEFGSVHVRPDGSAVVLTGSSAHGQGHHTTFAQVAADVLGIPFDRIEVRHGDTSEVARGAGTGGSRSLQIGGSAVFQASESVVDRAKQVAAELLEANPADIVLDTDSGRFSVAGTPAVSLDWSEVATKAEAGDDPLLSEIDFQPAGATFPFGVHASVVEIDRGTGKVTVVRHLACDDAGVIVNPMIVDGQVHGGVASGIGQALMEEFHYSPEGNPLTANFMDYGLISAAELPLFDRIEQETPTDRNPLGAKGIGESGTLGSTPAVQNAVVDALSHLGVDHVDIPLTPERVWRAMQTPTAD